MSKRAVALRHLETVLKSGREHLARRPPPEASQRPVVEQAVDALNLLLGDVVEPAAFRQDDPNDAVAVLVSPPLPRVVRLREEDVEAAIPHEHLELRILLAVVKRQGLHHLPRQIPQQRLEHGHDGIRLLGRRIPHQREARHALDEPLAGVVLLVERLLADEPPPVASGALARLLERPAVFLEPLLRLLPLGGRELAAGRRLGLDAAFGFLLGLLRPVAFLALVLLDLPFDRRAVASDLPCDLSVADAHPVQRGDRYALRLVQPRVLRRLAFLGLLRFLRIPAIGMLSALRLEGEFTRQRPCVRHPVGGRYAGLAVAGLTFLGPVP